MSEHKPRPVAFRLDDDRVAVEGGPKRAAPIAVIEAEREPIEEAAAVRGFALARSSPQGLAAWFRWPSGCG
jgi:hypothetical protein